MSTPAATHPEVPSTSDTLRQRRRRRTVVLLALAVTTFAVFAARCLLGDFTVTVPDFVRIVLGRTVDVPAANYIVMQSKLPRAMACLFAGAIFGASGAAMQSLVRNPLASPDVLGISLGSSTAAVFCITILGWSGTSVTVAAVMGGLAVALIILGMAKGQTARMILVGIALAAALQSVIQWILLKSSAYQAQDAMAWLAGSVSAVTWPQIARLAVVGVLVVSVLAVLAHWLRVLEMGRPLATGLGVPDGLVRGGTFAAIVVGVAVTTSVCGPIAFVALLAGPIARRLMGRTSIIAAALVGAIITIGGDYIGAYLVPGDNKLPVGVVTGLAGAPVLAWLLLTAHRPTRRPKGRS